MIRRVSMAMPDSQLATQDDQPPPSLVQQALSEAQQAVPEAQQPKFFVYVIESPSAPDLYHKRSESDVIKQAVGLNLIPCVARLAISREAFEAAIKLGLTHAMQQYPEFLPILHISAHGNANGLQLSDGEVVEWQELRTLLTPVNEALQGALIVCMSCCEGYAAIRMAMFTEDAFLPFYALVGSGSSPTWGETAIAFATFYHLIAKGESVPNAVYAMGIASGVQEFFQTTGEEQRLSFIEYIKRINAGEVREELKEESQGVPPPELAKMGALETGSIAATEQTAEVQ